MTPSPDQIRQARTDAGWTVPQMARELGVTTRAVNYWLSGDRRMPLPTWRLLQAILGR